MVLSTWFTGDKMLWCYPQQRMLCRYRFLLARLGRVLPGRLLVAVLALWRLQSDVQGAVFWVTTTSDSGPGSLRQAILDANTASGPDEIRFNVPVGPFTIGLLAALPPISSPVVLDATTQPGFAGTPIVEINGAGGGANAGLRITGGNTRFAAW